MRWYVVLALALACGTDDESRRPRAKLPFEEAVELNSALAAKEPPPPVTVESLAADGTHWRIQSPHGPIHVWVPKGYQRRRAETIVYVHGYYVHVDESWDSYHLPHQFAAAGINAAFIACEAPASPAETVSWPTLKPLLDTVDKAIAQPLPRRRIVAVGHSAAYRTLLGWLDEPLLDTVVLLDAAYGEIDQYKKWIEASEKHRLIDVGDDTRGWTDQLHAALPDSVVLDGFPSLEDGIPKEARRARILYIKSSMGHFPLVTGGIALPMILRTLRAKQLLHEPLAELLDDK
jgi:hypothetical protein